MTRTFKSIVAATLVASTFALGAIAPAEAGGSLSIQIGTSDPEAAQAMKLGLGMFALVNGMSEQGGISQNGIGNLAGVFQGGAGNQAVIVQEGNGHNGTITQTGDNNSCGLFQFGENTDTHIEQTGDEACLAFAVGF